MKKSYVSNAVVGLVGTVESSPKSQLGAPELALYQGGQASKLVL